MTDSPRALRLATPSWLDARLVLGLLLVLVSVVVGARVLAAADDSQRVWVATRDLAPGARLAEGDLEQGRVRLFDHGERYLRADGPEPVGYVLTRGVGADELLPAQSLRRPDDVARPLRDVSVPVAAGHLPGDLRSGQQVDVFVTAGAATAGASPAPAPGGTTRLVLRGVPVTLRAAEAGLGQRSSGVVLSVPESDAPLLVQAVQQGEIDLVRVPRTFELPTPAAVAAPVR